MKKSILIICLFIYQIANAQQTIQSFGFRYNVNSVVKYSIEVNAVFLGTSAYENGLKADDYITEINGKSIAGWTGDQVAEEISISKKKGVLNISNGKVYNITLKLKPLKLKNCISGNCNNGKGKQFLAETNSTYEGEFKDSLYNGKGTIIYHNLFKFDELANTKAKRVSKFEGTFINGEPNIGTYYFKDGSKFMNEEQQEKHSVYFPQILNYNGKGTLVTNDGDKYEGVFTAGKKMKGIFKLTTKEGVIKNVEYAYGEMVANKKNNETIITVTNNNEDKFCTQLTKIWNLRKTGFKPLLGKLYDTKANELTYQINETIEEKGTRGTIRVHTVADTTEEFLIFFDFDNKNEENAKKEYERIMHKVEDCLGIKFKILKPDDFIKMHSYYSYQENNRPEALRNFVFADIYLMLAGNRLALQIQNIKSLYKPQQ